jgi:hypothetical protein
MKECDFCRDRTDGKLILRNDYLLKKDHSEFTVCSICLDLYVNYDFDKLEKRINGEKT